jgi:SHAQKYF class myb-like DNA-binding protein
MKNEFGGHSAKTPGDESKRFLREKTNRSNYNFVPESFLINQARGKRNGRWTIEEHERFIEGVFKHGNNWKGISEVIKTRTCPQARSHGQKFFTKLKKITFEALDKEQMNVRDLHDKALTLCEKDLEQLKINLVQAHVSFEKMEENKNELILIEDKEIIYDSNLYYEELNLEMDNSYQIQSPLKSKNLNSKIIKNKKSPLKKSSTLTSAAGKEYTDKSDNEEEFCENSNLSSFKKSKEEETEKPFFLNYKEEEPDNRKNDKYYDMMKNRLSSYAKERGEINQSVVICGKKILDNINNENFGEILYQKLYNYQDEVCLDNFCKH